MIRPVPPLTDLGVDLRRVEVQVTRYPQDGSEPTVIAQSHHPLDLTPAYGGGMCDHPLRNPIHPSWPWRIRFCNLAPAQPRWLHGTMELITPNSVTIGGPRPATFYAGPSELGTFVYVPQQDWDDASYSIGLRIAGS